MPSIAANVVDIYPYRMAGDGPSLLALHRAPGLTLAGSWQMVSGLIEEGEAAWEAGLRELREETGLEPLRLFTVEPLATFYVPWLDRVIISPAFAVEVADGAVALSEEHDAYAWCSPHEMFSRLEWPSQRRAVQELVAILAQPGGLTYREVPLSGPIRPGGELHLPDGSR